MATLVSTGQITIIDQNDAKTITAYLSTNRPFQQIFSKDDTTQSYVPDYTSTTLIISPKLFIGGVSAATDLSSNTTQITNRKWSKSVGGTVLYDGGTTTQDTTSFLNASGGALAAPFAFSANGTTLTISGNLKESVNSYPIYFECDYTDPTTNLTSHIVTSIELTVIKTGTNAVFVTVRGRTVIEESNTSTKNAVAICADLIRAAGIDRNNLSYKWYDITTGTAVQVSTSVSGYAAKYNITDTLSTAVPIAATVSGAGVPASGGANTYNASGVGNGNTLTISESAVTDIGVFRVDVTDTSESKTYSATFTVYDITDPYEVKIISSTGDKLLNGQGSSTLTPEVYNGASKISSLTDWTFNWVFFDKNGKRAAFIDRDSTTSASSYYNNGDGRLIGVNAYNTSTRVLTHGAVSPANGVSNNNIVKIVKDGIAYYYEITAATTTSVTLSNAPTKLSLTDFPLPTATNQFEGGVIYLCTKDGTYSTDAGASIVITGEDIDSKGTINCLANRP